MRGKIAVVRASAIFVPPEELSRLGIPDLDRKLPVPRLDLACLQKPIQIHRFLSLELGIIGVAVVHAADRIIFSRLGPLCPAHLPA